MYVRWGNLEKGHFISPKSAKFGYEVSRVSYFLSCVLNHSTKGDLKSVLKLPRLARRETHLWAGINS